jgi:hypothetical protein
VFYENPLTLWVEINGDIYVDVKMALCSQSLYSIGSNERRRTLLYYTYVASLRHNPSGISVPSFFSLNLMADNEFGRHLNFQWTYEGIK